MKVLIADDDNVNRRILQTFLGKWGYEIVAVESGDAAWEILQREDAPRLVILDWMMPGLDGAQVCREVRKRGGSHYTYIMLITTKFQKQDILDGLEAGADDYLTKPFDSNELRARLRTGSRILELQEELVRSRENLKFQASHDLMTGIWNHAAILDILTGELDRCRREKHTVGVVLLDIDHFKSVNDRYGHLAGDSVLRETVRRMRSRLRSYDSIGRYGGEEFLVVMPNCGPEQCLNQAERIRHSVSDSPMDMSEGIISITISAGGAVGCGTDLAEMECLLKNSDIALYRAKARGRNCVEAAWQNPSPALLPWTMSNKSPATETA